MKKIIFATGNENKLIEIREILAGKEYEIESMKQAGIDLDIQENGSTFEENSVIKAKAVHDWLKKNRDGEEFIVLADDSGLVIDALNGEPGIYSARYLGHDTSYTVKNQNLLDRMKDVPEEKRTARFVCCVAAVFPDGRVETRQGTMEGRIAHQIAGNNGFGYDPIFYLPEFQKTSAEISPEEKNEISHRGKALRAISEIL